MRDRVLDYWWCGPTPDAFDRLRLEVPEAARARCGWKGSERPDGDACPECGESVRPVYRDASRPSNVLDYKRKGAGE